MVNHRHKKEKTAKLAAKYVGPYCVLQVFPNHTYLLGHDGQHSVENETRLKLYVGPTDSRAEAPVLLEPTRRKTMMGRAPPRPKFKIETLRHLQLPSSQPPRPDTNAERQLDTRPESQPVPVMARPEPSDNYPQLTADNDPAVPDDIGNNEPTTASCPRTRLTPPERKYDHTSSAPKSQSQIWVTPRKETNQSPPKLPNGSKLDSTVDNTIQQESEHIRERPRKYNRHVISEARPESPPTDPQDVFIIQEPIIIPSHGSNGEDPLANLPAPLTSFKTTDGHPQHYVISKYPRKLPIKCTKSAGISRKTLKTIQQVKRLQTFVSQLPSRSRVVTHPATTKTDENSAKKPETRVRGIAKLSTSTH